MDQNEHPDDAGLRNLVSLMTLSDGRLASELGVSAATVRSWRNGRRTPSPENRLHLGAAARKHAFAILRMVRDLAGDEAPTLDGRTSMAVDLGELRTQMDRAGSHAATIRRELEQTARLLAGKG